MEKDKNTDRKVINLFDSSDKREKLPPEKRTIYTGIKIDGSWIDFEARPFVEDRITMMIPVEFKEMDPEIARVKYPMEQRPQTILTDSTGTVNFLFSYMDEPISDQDTTMIRDKMLGVMTRVNPGVRAQSTGEELIDDRTVAYAEFSNPAIDGRLYNLMFFMELDGKALMGSFNCLTKSMKRWNKHAFEMMRSIKIIVLKD